MLVLRSRIFWKLIFTYILLVTTILIIVDFYVSNVVSRNRLNQIEDQLKTAASILLGEIPDVRDPKALSIWAASASRRSNARVTVIDGAGGVLADSEQDTEAMGDRGLGSEIQQALAGSTGINVRYSTTVKKDVAYLAVPIGTYAVLRLALPLKGIQTETNQVRKRTFFVLIVALLIGGLMAYFFSRSLTRRIERIADFSQEIAAGNLSERINLRGDDEVGSLGRSLNVTADKLQKTIEQLTRERNKLEVVLSSMVEGVLAIDLAKKIILANPAFGRIFSVDTESSIGKTLLETTRHSELDQILDFVLKRGEKVKKFASIDFPEEKTFEVLALPLLSQHVNGAPNTGNVIGAMAVLHDITELKRVEAIRRDFVANVSHELRTPLAAIKGYAETLLDGALEDPDHRRHFIEVIHNSADRLTRITGDLLTLSTVTSEGFRLHLTRFNIGESVNDVLPVLREQASKKRQAIKVNVPSDLPHVVADRERMNQVLLNLVDNAIKFTPEGGVITLDVRAATGSDRIEVRVSDTGIGIPRKDLPRIFERFYRVDKARSRALGGTGLGLSIVKHIIEAHNGTIRVESALGRGSTFIFTVPKA